MREIIFVNVEPKCGHSFSVASVLTRTLQLFAYVTYTKAVWRKRLCSECHAAKLFGRG